MITRLPIRVLSASATPKSLSRLPERHIRLPKLKCSQQAPLRIRRQYSTPPTEAARPSDLRSQFSSAEKLQSPTQPTPKRSLRPYIYATLFLMLGLTAGQYVRMVLVPPPLPAAGTREDELMVEYLQKHAEKLPIVQSLSTDPNWNQHEAYSSLADPERDHRLTTGPLGGARALGGFQRIFSNKESGEVVTVIWFGGAIAGWPGVTHGGVTATIMDESLGRCAVRLFPSRTGVTANLELNYLKPIVTNSFYVVRSVPEQGHTDTKAWVNGRLETLEGRVCVEAKALFVVPKKFRTRPLGKDF
jgi:acyl-coenzyme A thioesterase PaaI-like protein